MNGTHISVQWDIPPEGAAQPKTLARQPALGQFTAQRTAVCSRPSALSINISSNQTVCSTSTEREILRKNSNTRGIAPTTPSAPRAPTVASVSVKGERMARAASCTWALDRRRAPLQQPAAASSTGMRSALLARSRGSSDPDGTLLWAGLLIEVRRPNCAVVWAGLLIEVRRAERPAAAASA